jgi:hypothetical protein
MADGDVKLRVQVDGTDSVRDLVKALKEGKLSLNEITQFKKALNEQFRDVKQGSAEYTKWAYAIAQVNDAQRDMRILTKAGHEEYFKLGLELRQMMTATGQLGGTMGKLANDLSGSASAAVGLAGALKPLGISMNATAIGAVALFTAMPSVLNSLTNLFRTTSEEMININSELEHTLRLQSELGKKTDKDLLAFYEKSGKAARKKLEGGSPLFMSTPEWEKEKKLLTEKAQYYEFEAAKIIKRTGEEEDKARGEKEKKELDANDRALQSHIALIEDKWKREEAIINRKYALEKERYANFSVTVSALERERLNEIAKMRKKMAEEAGPWAAYLGQVSANPKRVGTPAERMGRDMKFGQSPTPGKSPAIEATFDAMDNAWLGFESSVNSGVNAIASGIANGMYSAFEKAFNGANSLLEIFVANVLAEMAAIAARMAAMFLLEKIPVIGPLVAAANGATSGGGTSQQVVSESNYSLQAISTGNMMKANGPMELRTEIKGTDLAVIVSRGDRMLSARRA